MNSLSGTLYEDFVSRFMPKDITQKRVSQILKLIVIIIGIIATSLVFVVERMGGLLPLSITFSGITSGPLLGLFILGMIFPFANAKGAFIGTVSSIIFVSWIVIGAQWYKSKGLLKYIPKPLSSEGCNTTYVPYINMTQNFGLHEEEIFILYRITYYYYSLCGALVVLIVGLPISWYTKNGNPPLNKNLITPCMHWALSQNTEIAKKCCYVFEDIDIVINESEGQEVEKMIKQTFS